MRYSTLLRAAELILHCEYYPMILIGNRKEYVTTSKLQSWPRGWEVLLIGWGTKSPDYDKQYLVESEIGRVILDP